MKSWEMYREIVNAALPKQLDSLGRIPGPLRDSMMYSLTAGGKRLRPVMLLAACDMAGGNPEQAVPFACALEMIHTYSLIHDDLPGMDNDDLRRGKPTNHKVFGEGVAILAGDGLLNAAMEIVLRASLICGGERGLRAAEILVRRAGVTGMIAGQAVDVTAEGCKPTEELVSYIHEHKTAALLQAPVEMGFTLAGCGEEVIEAGSIYALHLGTAFQIVDDLLDVTGDPALMGKNTGMDEKKLTWIALRGVEGARKDAETHTVNAVEALKKLPWDTGFFEMIARDNLTRAY